MGRKRTIDIVGGGEDVHGRAKTHLPQRGNHYLILKTEVVKKHQKARCLEVRRETLKGPAESGDLRGQEKGSGWMGAADLPN